MMSIINIKMHHNDPNHDDDDIKEEEVGGQCSGGEGEEAVAKKFVQIIHNLKVFNGIIVMLNRDDKNQKIK